MKMILSVFFAGLCVASAMAQAFDSPKEPIGDDRAMTETIFPPVPLPSKPTFSARSTTPERITGTFTDSQGRTTMYRYSIPVGMDLSKKQPFLVDFHGNNYGTQASVLDDFFDINERDAHARGLVAVMVTSPDTKEHTGAAAGKRHWDYDLDRKLIQEFLQQQVPKLFKPDYDRVYFTGGSQGTCFLNVFLPAYGESYKGGFFAGCGCHNYTDPDWDPSQAFIDGMKVYVSSSQGDFLYNSSKSGYEYYKYTIGLDVRADLDREGGHCELIWEQQQTGLDWLLGKMTLPEEPFAPHWQRVSADKGIDVALDESGRVVKSHYDDVNDKTTVEISDTHGKTWQEHSVLARKIDNLFALNGTLYAVKKNVSDPYSKRLVSSNDFGEQFDFVSPMQDEFVDRVAGDGSALYLEGFNGVVRRLGQGLQVTEFGGYGNRLSIMSNDAVDSVASGYILLDERSITFANKAFLISNTSDQLKPITLPITGTTYSMTWDGATLYAVNAVVPDNDSGCSGYPVSLLKSSDWGQKWEAVSWSMPDEVQCNGSIPQVTALGQEKLLVHGGSKYSPLFTKDAGANWTDIVGFSSWKTRILSNDIGTYLTSKDGGLFRLVLSEADENPTPIDLAKNYIITVTQPQKGGSLSCDASSADAEDIAKCTAVPDDDYGISEWGGVCKENYKGRNECRFTVEGDSTVSVMFKPRYHVSAIKPRNGYLACDSEALEGETIKCIAIADEGFVIGQWAEACQGMPAEKTACEFVITESSKVAVEFKPTTKKSPQTLTLEMPSVVDETQKFNVNITGVAFTNNCFTHISVLLSYPDGLTRSMFIDSPVPELCREMVGFPFEPNRFKVVDGMKIVTFARHEGTDEIAMSSQEIKLTNDIIYSPAAKVTVDKPTIKPGETVTMTFKPQNPTESCITKIIYYPLHPLNSSPIEQTFSATTCAEDKVITYRYDEMGEFHFAYTLFDKNKNSCEAGNDEGCKEVPKISVKEALYFKDSFEAR